MPLTKIDANGQTMTLEYDAYLRPKKVTPPSGSGIAETIYNDTPGNVWMKTRAQIDATNWAESYVYYDGIGRVVKAKKTDSQGNVITQTQYDTMGRVKQTTNFQVFAGTFTKRLWHHLKRFQEMNLFV